MSKKGPYKIIDLGTTGEAHIVRSISGTGWAAEIWTPGHRGPTPMMCLICAYLNRVAGGEHNDSV